MNTDNHHNSPEPTGLEIAVIGISLRFPGADNVTQFLQNLTQGKESVRFFTSQELEKAGVGEELIRNPDYVAARGYLEHAEAFDAGFFGYTPLEATAMDPQIRLFHTCTWEALEDAGYDPNRYEGLIGLYGGASLNNNWQLLVSLAGQRQGLDAFSQYQLINKDNLTTHVSYNLNLKGPSYSLNTACSTSLTALHVACQALLSGECSIALAGGVTVSYPRKTGYLYHEGMVNSPDGHCRTFDAAARGTVGGEGCGVVALKLLEDAVDDHDHIYAVVKGSAINNDGKRKTGYTAPSIKGQTAVIKAAYKMAEVEPQTIGLIEAHGTATILGDPIEIEALIQAFDTSERQFCAIGSVKTNFGHLDSAAGIAGFIKAVLSLHTRQIFPSLYFKTPNPKIDFDNSPFYVPTETRTWTTPNGPRRAGVSSFGIGGTNVHVVLEEAPMTSEAPETSNSHSNAPQLLVLSAATESALHQMTHNLASHFQANPHLNINDVAYTLQQGRKEMTYRHSLVAASLTEAIDPLTATPKIHRANDKNRVIFLFPGLGAQYLDMGRGLYRQIPRFQQEMERCFQLLKPLLNTDLKEILYPPGKTGESGKVSPAGETITGEAVYPLLFSIQYALSQLLIAWGIHPDAVMGYSFGEFIAATVAGVFSLEDALNIIVGRNRLIRQIPEGAMLSVPLPKEQLVPLLDREDNSGIQLAIDNGDACIVSGTTAQIQVFEKKMKDRRLLCMRLPEADRPLHSSAMTPILDQLETLVKQADVKEPQIPYISNVTGTWIQQEEIADPRYWCRQLSQTVLFADGIRELVQLPNALFLEVGPGRDLATMVKRYSGENPTGNSPTIDLIRNPQKDIDDFHHLLNRLGRLWCNGVSIDWDAFHADTPHPLHRLSLPLYPFQETQYTPDPDGKILALIQQIMGGKQIDALSSLLEEARKPLYSPETLIPKTSSEKPFPSDSPRSFGGDTPYAAPMNQTQETLIRIWQDYFGLSPIGIHDDFFELGGDSLKAMNVSNLLRSETGVDIPVAEFFQRLTPEGLATYIHENRTSSETLPLEPVEKQDYYPLAPAQERQFILWQLDPQSTAYNEYIVVILEGLLDIDKMEHIFKRLIQRHESLRTSFIMIDRQPVQRVHDDFRFEIERLGEGAATEEQILARFIRPFDLTVAPLFRIGMAGIGENRHLVILDMHHIVSDGMSQSLLMSDFMTLYSGGHLPELEIQYKEYSCHQRRLQATGQLEEKVKYWLQRFKQEVPALELPLDFPRPSQLEYAGAELKDRFHADGSTALKKLARQQGITIFPILLSAYYILLSKLANSEDIVIGSPTAGRSHAALHGVFGMFVNTLALRNFPVASKKADDFLNEVARDTLDAFENQQFQLEELVEHTVKTRDPGRNPLFDVMLVLQNTALPTVKIPDLKMAPASYEKRVAKFDITMTTYEVNDEIAIEVEYRTKLFRQETIGRFIGYYKRILKSLATSPEKQLREIDILSHQEKETLLERFNKNTMEFPGGKTIHQLFKEQAQKTPHRIAVTGDYRSHMSYLSYNFLNRQTDRIARQLQQKGVNGIVAVKMERSLNVIIAILSILKAGAAYLPIDPNLPQERIQYMLKDSNAQCTIIDHRSSLKIIDNVGVTSKATASVDSSSLCYVIYTSGTTGRPKGVMVEHSSLVNSVAGLHREVYHRYPQPLKTGLLASFVFDASVLHLFAPLVDGHTLTLLPEETRSDGNLLLSAIQRHKLDLLECAPVHLSLLMEAATNKTAQRLTGFKQILVGGEELPRNRVEAFNRLFSVDTPAITNLYGPTECTVAATFNTISEESISPSNVIPIGKPLPNYRIYILDADKNMQPTGVVGELYIAGEGLARGYLNRPPLTAEKFIHISFPGGTSQKVYRTGDLGRWLSDGNIEFSGRSDRQVKIRGYRIELGEIEFWLTAHETISQAVVETVETNDNTGQTLCAYVVGSGTVDEPAIRNYLKGVLPHYMVPASIVVLEQFPLTPGGKIDRRGLPKPGAGDPHRYLPPRNPLEKTLVAIWSNLLEVEETQIGIQDDFFSLGGHSLKAVQVINAIHKELNVRLAVQTLFQASTVAALAQEIEGQEKSDFLTIPRQPEQPYYELSYTQRRMWVLQRRSPESTAFNMSDSVLLTGPVDEEQITGIINTLVARHEGFRTAFREIEGDVLQVIEPIGHVEIRVTLIDISNETAPLLAQRRREEYVAEIKKGFNLEEAPLIRFKLVKWAADKTDLIFNMHHLIGDGWTVEILKQEFFKLLAQPGTQLTPLTLQYRDYAVWHNRLLADRERMEPVLNFWRRKLDCQLPVVELPYDMAESLQTSHASSGYCFYAVETLTHGLRELAGKNRTSLFVVLLGAFQLLLSYLRGQEDILLAIPGAARPHDDLKSIMGVFVNTLIVRERISSEETFSQFLDRVSADTMTLLEYQTYPMEMIFDQLDIAYPRINVFFNMINTGQSHQVTLKDFTAGHVPERQEAKFPLVLYLEEYRNGIRMTADYYKQLFRPETMEKIMQMYLSLLTGIAADPDKPVNQYKGSGKTGKKRKLRRG